MVIKCRHLSSRKAKWQGQRARAAEGQTSFITLRYIEDLFLKSPRSCENEQMDNKISLCAASCTKRAEYLKAAGYWSTIRRRTIVRAGWLFVLSVHTAHGHSSYRKGWATINALSITQRTRLPQQPHRLQTFICLYSSNTVHTHTCRHRHTFPLDHLGGDLPTSPSSLQLYFPQSWGFTRSEQLNKLEGTCCAAI